MPVQVEKKGDKVKDWMSKEPVTIDFTESVTAAASMMAEKQVGSLLITEKEKKKKLFLFSKKLHDTAGIVTDTDLVRKVIAKHQDPDKTMISSVMNSNIISIESSKNILEASTVIAKHHIKRLPVIDDGYTKGVITATDIMYALSYNNRLNETHDLIKDRVMNDDPNVVGSEQSKVRTWMSSRLSLIGETESIRQVTQMMESREIGAILVIGLHGDLAGIVTDTDIVRKVLATKLDPDKITVSKIMTRDVISVSPEMEIPDLANVMTENKIKRTAVIENDQLMGIISISDVMNALFKLSKTSNLEPVIRMLKEK